ncbi:MAG: hypothetical protein ACOC22_02185, partial [bacterium]
IKRDYKPNISLPAAIVKLEEERFTFGERPTVISRQHVPNCNQIPILSDPETKKMIYQQEEHTTINVSVTINCESQFQAKEVEYQIKRYLPIEKYIQLLTFTSFLEIPRDLLLTLDMNFNDREITNLFMRFNKNLGQSEYCYSVKYEPLIRLSSSSVNISSSNQRSFAANINLEYMIQIPMWICSWDEPGTIERIAIDFYRFSHEPISENSVRPILNLTPDDKYDKLKHVTKRNLLIHDWDDYYTTEDVTIDDTDYKKVGIKFPKEDFIISPDFRFNIFDNTGKLNYNIQPEEVDTDDNYVTFLFTNSEFEKYTPSLTTPLVMQFVEVRS